MKEIITTVVMCSIICCAFAQKTFKRIDFHKANSTIIRQNVFDRELVSTLASAKTGSIVINTKDGQITINITGEGAKVYKIKTVGDEVKDEWDNKTVTISCTDDSGTACDAIIKKRYAFTSSNEMLFNIKYSNGTGKGYFCDYLANLYEN
jgi:hypothetical protein